MRTRQARYLRRTATPAEKKLWSRLRNRQLIGLKFRRQQPVGDRILDFLCEEVKLGIELDGSRAVGADGYWLGDYADMLGVRHTL